MKKVLFVAICMVFFTCSNAQTMKTIKLNAPNTERGLATMKALEQRQSVREYSDRELSVQDLSDLLWAANGFNRPDKRTAGTAMNCQEIDIYVCMKDGAYIYDAKAHELKQISTEDLRQFVAGAQDFAKTAPISLVIVADMERFQQDNEAARTYTAYDAGIVSQNISLFCSGCGLGTVTRGIMDKAKLTEGLKLTEKQVLHLNHPVGYLK